MKIAIIGYGFVGRALKNALNNSVNVFIVDPILGTDIKDLKNFNPKFIFVCVPTPMLDDGSQDCTILHKVVDEIIENNLESIIKIKSTILPNVINSICLRLKTIT